MDVDEDSDLFFKTQAPLGIYWRLLLICDKYQLKKATHLIINHSYFELQCWDRYRLMGGDISFSQNHF